VASRGGSLYLLCVLKSPLLVSRAGVTLLALLSSLTTGCLTNVDAFAKKIAKFDCINFEECEGAQFSVVFSSQSDCRDETTDDYEEIFDELEECDYNPKEARKCIRTLRKNKKECSDRAYNDIEDDCEDVFDCSIDVPPPPPPSSPGLELDDDVPMPELTAAESMLDDAEYPVSRPVFESAFR